jgi:EAL domain-containing protein (putative c-di-GMP-specific phosphodiesterase class I)
LATDELAIYGTAHRKALEALSDHLSTSAAAIAGRFYAAVSKRPESKRILERLSKAERDHLETQQMRNLLRLASPDLAEADHRDLARKVGRIHATLGLDHEELVHSQALFTNAIFRKIDREAHGEALAVLNQRFARDLAIQTEVYQELQSARSELVLSIVHTISESKNFAELIDGVVREIGKLAEVAGCAVGRYGAEGTFHYEAVADGPLHDCIHEIASITAGLTEHGAAAVRCSPAPVAWRTGTIQRSINVATDVCVEPWRDALLRGGFRSLVAIPLCRGGEAPQAVLCIFSALPGGFSGTEQQDFIAVIRTLIEFAMTRLRHAEGGTQAVPFSDRRRWSALLRSDALEMHYQPILDLKTRSVTKVEALARLRDGGRLLAPGLFLPTLSRDDYYELFARGMRQALAQRNRWLREGIDLNISLNLPPIGLSDARYFEATREALSQHACAPQNLTLEVLETEDVQGARTSSGVTRFKELGVVLAQDDLGAGHSSLNRLRELPFDCIKIDKEIVRLDGNDSSDILRFVYQITRLAHSLGRAVVVEGVEEQGLIDAF